MKVGPRQAIHAHEEIEALLTGRKLTTIVFFLDEMFKEITYNMASTVADAIKEVAGIIKLSAPSSFNLFESRKVVTGTKSPDLGNSNHFYHSLESICLPKEYFADPMFLQLSYVQVSVR